jgi:hypothetical protein
MEFFNLLNSLISVFERKNETTQVIVDDCEKSLVMCEEGIYYEIASIDTNENGDCVIQMDEFCLTS